MTDYPVMREPYPKPVSDQKVLDPRIRVLASQLEGRYIPHIYEQNTIYTSTSAAAAVATGRTNTMGGTGDILGVDSASTKDILG